VRHHPQADLTMVSVKAILLSLKEKFGVSF
jgi:hypothetical protein